MVSLDSQARHKENAAPRELAPSELMKNVLEDGRPLRTVPAKERPRRAARIRVRQRSAGARRGSEPSAPISSRPNADSHTAAFVDALFE